MRYSVVCPFYNESAILEQAVVALLSHLASLDDEWELIIVNDGSVDGSEAIARRLERENPRLRVLGYPYNRGRGHALRTGIAAARGDLIVTTEIDLSWGDTIVQDLVAAMTAHPEADLCIASPNLPPGGYRNVPWRRVALSRVGNLIIRASISNAPTMNTGMTRCYRREFIQSIPLHEDGKEFHLEVVLKATAFGARMIEIPAVLEWKEYKHRDQRIKRKSSSRIKKLIVSHSLFSLFANPIRYVWAMAATSAVLGLVSLVWAVINLVEHRVSAYLAMMSVLLVILAIVLFVIGIVLQQGFTLQRELWGIQRSLVGLERPDPAGKAAPTPIRLEDATRQPPPVGRAEASVGHRHRG
jgi:glycosyltransferase involved in cell wall biosynthesis